jgi:hypothetical protein
MSRNVAAILIYKLWKHIDRIQNITLTSQHRYINLWHLLIEMLYCLINSKPISSALLVFNGNNTSRSNRGIQRC